MDFNILIWAIVVMMFVVMVIVIIRGNKALVYIYDEFNGITKKGARVNDGKQVSFKYNESSKGGVAIEGNKYKMGKKLVFLYRDIGGVLLPIKDVKIDEKTASLDLSTSQEKYYETKALENVVKKIDSTWWGAIKPIIMGAIIIFGAVIISIVAIQKALDVEPIPEPQVEMWQDTNEAMQALVKTNQDLVKQIQTDRNIKSNEETDPPR